MRIITGTVRGKKLKTPMGLDTRPTIDRVKQSIFNIIQFDIPQKKVLDLFAGSGQMGLETLSRGAQSCTFVDNGREALAAIQENIHACGMESFCRVESSDVLSFIARCPKNSFDIILLDPPYGGKLANDALKSLCLFDILTQDGLILCEMGLEDTLAAVADGYMILREYKYGKTKIVTVKRV